MTNVDLAQTQHQAALAHLAAADPVMARLIAGFGPIKRQRSRPRFYGLVRAILGQQISVKAADAIDARLRALFPDGIIDPTLLLALDDATLRGAGLSVAKLRSLRDLATHVASGALDLDQIHTLPDEDVIAQLVQVRGIGRWTAEMFLIFSLNRDDVLSVGDLGVRQGIQRLYGFDAEPTHAECHAIAEPWRPYRTIATFYLWHSLYNTLPL
jgi:DNA-3-methyladenine glycosylase II